ncbi:uncharacterized protein [Physcomitrium patens]|uniref:Phosphate acetyltransferase n=1 Tax=Physcomitrium patens TaxID=3218 RepID=A9RG05_PHYPA|nr:uncharacterized protein LOC112278832 [Physcomitrium patens]PNR59395.1 hypothetical protein PHYPA_002186 [Physcomitrium patens]|eukprot:XP_024368440.1 uncharacterized protein LOC112278832 [Physcomitrella patens]
MLRAVGKKVRRVLREELLAGLQGRGLGRIYDASGTGVRKHGWGISSRETHTNSLYIHHTIGGVGRDSVAVTVGLLHSLERLQPGIGYFRPIDQTTIGGYRSKLIKSVFKMKDDPAIMQGVTQDRAYELVTNDKIDDLLEEVLKAYEACRVKHDFVVVEGTSLRGGGDDTVTLNAKIAQTLGSSALLVTDAGIACGKMDKMKNWDGFDWEKRVVNNAKLSDLVFRREHVDVVGAIVHRTPQTERKDKLLRKVFEEMKIPFVGALPEDSVLRSVQVQDVAKKLEAGLLYPVEDEEVAMSTEVTQYLVATEQLSDLLRHLPRYVDPTKGSIVITSANRVDILLGLIHLHESKSNANIAAVVLSGGKPPPREVHELLKARNSGTLPIILSPQMTFETASALANVEGYISSKTPLKVERAQTLFDDNINMKLIKDAMFQERPVRMNSKLFQHNLFTRAKQCIQTIVLPEGEEPRTLQAAGTVLRRGLCNLILLGDREKIETLAKQFRVDISQARIVDPRDCPETEKYARYFYESRKHKGITLGQAHNILIGDVNYFGTCMVAEGAADGMVSGAVHTTANTVRPALQLIKTLPGIPVVSSVFFMCLPGKVLVYGDCAINSDPTSEELAAIAIASADTAAAFGIKPRVAMLSYATGDSNKGPLIQKVIDATAIARKLRPDLLIEGPLQYDAAVDPVIAKTKMKGAESEVAGKASVLIFPDLNTGNNTYKAVQQTTGAVAMGPLLQGLRKPVNDLSRGCTVPDIVTTIALTAVQAAAMKETAKRETPKENLVASAA